MLIEFLAPNVHNSIPRNRHFVLLLHFQLFIDVINKPDSSNYLAILMISLSYYIIFSFETINAVIRKAKFEGQPDQIIFFWIAASLSDASAISPNCIKRLLFDGFSTFFFKDKPVFSNGSESLPTYSVLFYRTDFLIILY